MNTHDLEFRISQYLDDTLPARLSAELEQEMIADEVTRALLAEYRQVDQYIKAAAGSLPAVDYDALSARISGAVAEIDAEPEVLYSFKWVRRAVGVAVAACVTIGVGMWMSSSMETAGRQVVRVELPKAQMISEPMVTQISVGPGAHAQSAIGIEEALVTRPTKLLIASAAPATDGGSLPY